MSCCSHLLCQEVLFCKNCVIVCLPVKTALQFFDHDGLSARDVSVSLQRVVTLASLPVVVSRAGGPQGTGVPQTQAHALSLGVCWVDVVALLVGSTLVVGAAADLHTVVVWVALQALRTDTDGLVEVHCALGATAADLVQAGVDTFVVHASLGPWAVVVLGAFICSKKKYHFNGGSSKYIKWTEARLHML